MWLKFFWIFCAILPFSFTLSPFLSVDLQFARVFALFVFASWLAYSLAKKNLLIEKGSRLFLLLVFFLFCALSIFWSIDSSRAIRKTIFLLNFLPLYAVSFGATKTQKQRLLLLKIFTWSALVLAVFSLLIFLMQFFWGIDPVLQFVSTFFAPFFLGKNFSQVVLSYPSWMVNVGGKTLVRTFGTFPDPHLFSLYLNILLPLIFLLYRETHSKKYLAIFAVALTASLLSFSRAAYFSLGGALLFLLATTNTKLLLKKSPLFFLFTAFLTIAFLAIPNPLTNRLLSSFDPSEGSNSGRIEMWEKAVQTTIDFPLQGVGLGNFSKHIDPSASYREPIYAHNLFLDFSSETGIPNTFLLFLLLCSPLLAFFKKPSSTKKALAVSFVIFLIHSLFETPFYSIHVLPLILILLGFQTDEKSA